MNAGRLFGTMIILLSLSLAHQALAADFTLSSTSACALADAISAANLDQAVGGCPAGAGADTIYLTDNIILDDNLPAVVSSLTVTSDNYRFKRVISGDRARPIFKVFDGGRLTLRQLDLIDGHGFGAHGGALSLAQGYAHLTEVRLENNWARRGGGALSVSIGSSAYCAQCQFVNNQSGNGGAIWIGDASSSVTLANSLLYYNSADRGGGIFIQGGRANISGSTFSQNVAGIAQGADILSIGGAVDIDAATIINPSGIVQLSG